MTSDVAELFQNLSYFFPRFGDDETVTTSTRRYPVEDMHTSTYTTNLKPPSTPGGTSIYNIIKKTPGGNAGGVTAAPVTPR